MELEEELFLRTPVWFPAPMSAGCKMPTIPAAEDLMPTLASMGNHTHVVPYMHAHIRREFIVLDFSCRSLLRFNFVWSDPRGGIADLCSVATFL